MACRPRGTVSSVCAPAFIKNHAVPENSGGNREVIWMTKYLVTGVAGFIGSSIAHELVARGETVRGLDDFSTGKRENIAGLGNKLDFHETSLLDKAGLAAACAGIDYVIHQAAL